jgi:hypothetical protein
MIFSNFPKNKLHVARATLWFSPLFHLLLAIYRPVSLQHSVPKLLAKVLANRLQPKIKQLVDEMQSGFIKDRSIVENFAAAIEMIQCSNKLRRPVIVLKLDFQKAFDIVHWEAILATLAARGFPERWN